MTVLIRDLYKHVNSTVTLAGWLYNARVSSKVAFLVVRDGTGLCQCVVGKQDVPLEVFETASRLGQESSLKITGRVKAEQRAPGGYELHISGVEVIHAATDFPITPTPSRSHWTSTACWRPRNWAS